MDILAERLKYLRTKHNLTQSQAGEIVGVQYKTYQKYEYDDANPPIPMLIKFAQYYNVSVNFLTGYKDDEREQCNTKQVATLSTRLQMLRKQKELYQKEAAVQLELTQRSLQNYELGLRTPNIESLCKLAAFYGVSVDYLVGLDVAE